MDRAGETLTLLKTVKFDHQTKMDEDMGLIKRRPKPIATRPGSNRPSSVTSSNFSASTYADWRDDPFYDIDPYLTDEEDIKKMDDERVDELDADDTVISTQPSIGGSDNSDKASQEDGAKVRESKLTSPDHISSNSLLSITSFAAGT